MIASLYIHIPFCRYKCAYCDFVSYPHAFQIDDLVEKYVDALIEELHWWQTLIPYLYIDTVYIGGGTPSALPLHLQERIYKFLSEWQREFAEFTIEANPEDVSGEWLSFLKEWGITRISVGIQTFSEELLRQWRRMHSVSDSLRALQVLSQSDFNFNVDLIYPTYMPEVSDYSFRGDINAVLKFKPHHISVYLMDIHEGTLAFKSVHSGKWKEVPEGRVVDDLSYFYEVLKEHGYIHYEISNFAQSGKESKHNIRYWLQEFYIGAGISAWGFINFVRYENLPTIQDYIRGNVRRDFYKVSGKDVLSEYGLMVLRLLTRGIERRRWEILGGSWEDLIDRAKNVECVNVYEDRILLKDSVDCILVSNSIIEEILEPWL